MISREIARDKYRAHNMRLTPQRLAVVDELVGDTSHPTADEVAKRVMAKFPGVSLSTIYKTLNELVDFGLVRRVEGRGSGNEAAHFDPNNEIHGHIHCKKCGCIEDFEIFDGYISDIERVEEVLHVKVESAYVELIGKCKNCL